MQASTRLRTVWTAVLAALLVASLARTVAAAEESEEELAKKTQNPVADLISVPFTQLSVFYNAVRPDQASDVQVRFQLQFLFPK